MGGGSIMMLIPRRGEWSEGSMFYVWLGCWGLMGDVSRVVRRKVRMMVQEGRFPTLVVTEWSENPLI